MSYHFSQTEQNSVLYYCHFLLYYHYLLNSLRPMASEMVAATQICNSTSKNLQQPTLANHAIF